MRPKILCLMGPTASGKTDLSFELAQAIPCEVVSVDSAMVFLGMNIGTAKPTEQELAAVPHHLINIIKPTEIYSAAHFEEDATQAMTQILAKGKLPVLVGGTMLYFKALQYGLSFLPAANEVVRQQLTARARQEGWPQMHTELSRVDPISAQKINPTDSQRIQRALEVYELTGQPLSTLWQKQIPIASPFEFINVAVTPKDRSFLHQKIAMRLNHMLDNGFIEELITLRKQYDLHANLPSMRSVGYRQIWQYLEGELRSDELNDKAIAATRQLAKRQLTWLRHWHDLTWFDTSETNVIHKLLQFVEQQCVEGFR